MYTVIQSLTRDGRDRGLDYKISGFHVPPGCWDAQVLDEINPGGDEIVLPKSSSSVFSSTVLHTILGNMGITQLILCGCVTDQCVEHTVRDACDLGYLVTLVTGMAALASHLALHHAGGAPAVSLWCGGVSAADEAAGLRLGPPALLHRSPAARGKPRVTIAQHDTTTAS